MVSSSAVVSFPVLISRAILLVSASRLRLVLASKLDHDVYIVKLSVNSKVPGMKPTSLSEIFSFSRSARANGICVFRGQFRVEFNRIMES